MITRFYQGDPCPKCAHAIKRHGRSIWTLFLREPFLKCPNCKLVFIRLATGSPPESGKAIPALQQTNRPERVSAT